ncbi:ATP-dependent RNA helicase glh-1 [Rhynchospora pubera]|uniref:ATP-dependent RNA helicase glh-1 n=1 Tax=Rhynchospora pubera TaxID=906938 RepID=A0AAV8DDU6_9POAL|nr:ATP-dependent RNA helicase glh-1 [Rhynchospora pubera]
MNTRRNRGRGRPPIARQGEAQPVEQPVPPVNPVPAMEPAAYAQQLLANLAQIAAQVPERAQVDPFVNARREFQRENTPRFDGMSDFAAAEEWLFAVQNNFRLARTPAEYWTEIAATLFDQDARHWWTSQRPQYVGEDPNIPWQWFEEAFRARFLGETQQEELRRQFETLVQGNMSVQQYGETFIRLSRYAPDLVTDPRRKRNRFIRGLKPQLASVMDTYNGTSVEFLMDKAVFQESLMLARGKARDDGQSSGVRKIAFQGRGGMVSQGRQQPNQAPNRFFCRQCNKTYPGPCFVHKGGCRLCNSPDHWVAQCPKNPNRFNVGQSPSNVKQTVVPISGVGRGQTDAGRGRSGSFVPRGGGRNGNQRGGRFGNAGRGNTGQYGRDTARVHATIGEDFPDTETIPQEDEFYEDELIAGGD